MLIPRSSKALYHLAEILNLIHNSTPSLVKLSDIENLYRSSIELEGKDQNNGEVSKYLLETEVWNNLTKNDKIENDAKVPTNDKGSVVGKAKGKAVCSQCNIFKVFENWNKDHITNVSSYLKCLHLSFQY